MEIKKSSTDIFKEYEKGKQYNTQINLYENVEKNQRFFIGDQWYGVNAPGLSKPVFNMIKRVVSFFIAMLVSDDIAVNLNTFEESVENELSVKVLSNQIEKLIEKSKLKGKTRTSIKNCAVDGDTAMYISFNPDIETGQSAKGEIEIEIIDNTSIIFGNPYSGDLQKQPYLIVSQRLYVDQVKEMARDNGVSENEISKIIADDDSDNLFLDVPEDGLVTVLTKFWKEKETVKTKSKISGFEETKTVTKVHYIKCTKDCVIKGETNLEYSLYPLAYMTWEPKKKSYHGQSPITGLIPNQIYVNKLFAMAMLFTQNQGFPKLFYDSQKISQYTNDVSKAIDVKNLENLGKVMDGFKPPDFSSQIINVIELTINHTKEMMGASDASLGNVKPDNTSAIIAVQQATQAPLEIQKLAYYDYIEDIIRIIIDIMSADYGQRDCSISEDIAENYNLYEQVGTETSIDEMGNAIEKPVMEPVKSISIDFSKFKDINFDLNVDIGSSTFWSETTQIQTMDNLLNKGILDSIMYLEGIPDKYIKNKSKIIEKLKARQEREEALQAQLEQQQLGDVLAQEGNQLPSA